ncbi:MULTISPECIES: hypothetical protein [Paenibacillus]|uniref:Uncharacterized protein n=1 Tax=Paenibacillus odorifer TaxID=189426 RepID=A0ABX3HXZ5_9BACL|nr:hypothetical protein [Paenibacillus odorifer]OMD55279.1 hypothetical protein BSK51_04290 [Paenibacillus odorifer]
MTPERIKVIKKKLTALPPSSDAPISSEELCWLLAVLEESQQEQEYAKQQAIYWNDEAVKIKRQLVEAQQTIARQQEAMDRASDMMNHKHPAYRLLQDALLPAAEGSDKS